MDFAPIQEAAMDFNPIDVQKHLKGANYPASKDDLVSTAESNDAPNDLIEQLQNTNEDRFDGPDEVMAALKRG